jgi:hypothetical protein
MSSTRQPWARHNAGTCEEIAREQGRLVAAGAGAISSMAARSSAASRGSSFSAELASASFSAVSFSCSSSTPWRAARVGIGRHRASALASSRSRRTSRAAAATGSISA